MKVDKDTIRDPLDAEKNLVGFFSLLLDIDKRTTFQCFTPEIWTPRDLKDNPLAV
jgi:hypothetical protein